MNYLVRVVSTFLTGPFRYIKITRYSDRDVLTAYEASPAGLDSNPGNPVTALYVETSVNSDTAILGYFQKNRKAAPGEFRTYSTDRNGEEKTYTWLKADGTIEIGGDTDHMVRYSKLEEAYNQLKEDHDALVSDLNTLKQIFSTWSPVSGDGGGKLKTDAETWFTSPLSNSTGNIVPAKIEEIKTI